MRALGAARAQGRPVRAGASRGAHAEGGSAGWGGAANARHQGCDHGYNRTGAITGAIERPSSGVTS